MVQETVDMQKAGSSRTGVQQVTATERKHDALNCVPYQYQHSARVCRLELLTADPPMIMGLYHEAGFELIEVTSGLTLGFQYHDSGSLLTGCANENFNGSVCLTWIITV